MLKWTPVRAIGVLFVCLQCGACHEAAPPEARADQPVADLSSDPCTFPLAAAPHTPSWHGLTHGAVSFDPRWVAAIRRDPRLFAAMVGVSSDAVPSPCVRGLRAFLEGLNRDTWSRLTDEGARLVLAAAFTYEAADYGTTPPTARVARDFLAARTLDCGGDVELTVRLFFSTLGASDGTPAPDRAQLQTVVWRNDPEVPNHVGNHVQLFATGVGVNLLVDPTIGLIAHGDLMSHLQGVPVPPADIVYPLSPKAPTANRAFIRSVISSIDGTEHAPYADGRFLVSVKTPRFMPGAGEDAWDVDVEAGDWVDRIVADRTGGSWILTRRGVLLRADAGGLHASLAEVADIAGGRRAANILALSRDGQVVEVAPDGVEKVVYTKRALEVAADDAGEHTYIRTGNDALLERTADGTFVAVRHRIQAIASGEEGGALYLLSEDHALERFESAGADSVLAQGVRGMASLRYGEFVAYWTDAGQLLAFDRAGRRTAPLLAQVEDALVAPGDWTLDILQSNGVACRVDVDGRSGTLVPSSSINFDARLPMCGDIQAPAERVLRISLPDGDLNLSATTTAGTTIQALAATW